MTTPKRFFQRLRRWSARRRKLRGMRSQISLANPLQRNARQTLTKSTSSTASVYFLRDCTQRLNLSPTRGTCTSPTMERLSLLSSPVTERLNSRRSFYGRFVVVCFTPRRTETSIVSRPGNSVKQKLKKVFFIFFPKSIDKKRRKWYHNTCQEERQSNRNVEAHDGRNRNVAEKIRF